MKSFWISLLAASSFATSALADASITLGGGTLLDASNNTVNDGGLLLLVASTTDSSFANLLDGYSSTSVGSFLNGGDDQIIGRFTVDSLSSGLSGGYFTSLTGLTLGGNLTAGDSLQLYWFPTLTASSTSFGVGTSYGTYRTDSLLSGSDTGWFMPSDGASITLNFVTSSVGGDVSDAFAVASLTTVPEPATTAAILGAGAALFVFLRRRRQQQTRAAAPVSGETIAA